MNDFKETVFAVTFVAFLFALAAVAALNYNSIRNISTIIGNNNKVISSELDRLKKNDSQIVAAVKAGKNQSDQIIRAIAVKSAKAHNEKK